MGLPIGISSLCYLLICSVTAYIRNITLIYNFKDMDKNKLDFIMNHFNSLNELCNKIDNNKNDVIIDIKKC